MVQIDISKMSAGVHEITLHPPASDLDLDEKEFREIEAFVRLDVGEQQILARVEVTANASLICDRTLTPFTQQLRGEHTIVFAKRPIDVTRDDDTIRPLDPSARELDITDEIRDTILLSVPLRKVAPEASETELMLTFGADDAQAEPIDPRWEALRKLKFG